MLLSDLYCHSDKHRFVNNSRFCTCGKHRITDDDLYDAESIQIDINRIIVGLLNLENQKYLEHEEMFGI